MAKSKAKRHRQHLKRNGKLNPEINRGIRPDFSTHERKLPSKKEKLDQLWRKENRKEVC